METPEREREAATSKALGIAYLFGHPIDHSLSPLLHQTVYRALQMDRVQVPFASSAMSQFLPLMKDPKFYGASVTMPHKIAIMDHLDHLTDEAREVGACNTIFIREINGQRVSFGANTDVVGIREAFFQNVPKAREYSGLPAMVIGGGGAARSAVYALRRWLRCDPIYIVNRDEAEVDALIKSCGSQQIGGKLIHVQTEEQAQRSEAPVAVVSCIPDHPAITDAERRMRSVIDVFLQKPSKGAILEMCYHPSPWTKLADAASNQGWQVILGTEAMIWQGLEQDRYWTGLPLEKLPVAEVKEAIAGALNRARL